MVRDKKNIVDDSERVSALDEQLPGDIGVTLPPRSHGVSLSGLEFIPTPSAHHDVSSWSL